jgi:hypothetical protein
MTGACLDSKEPYPEKMQSGEVDRDIPKEHAFVKLVGGLRKQHGGWNLTGKRRHKSQE